MNCGARLARRLLEAEVFRRVALFSSLRYKVKTYALPEVFAERNVLSPGLSITEQCAKQESLTALDVSNVIFLDS